jgi:hypothetical protein
MILVTVCVDVSWTKLVPEREGCGPGCHVKEGCFITPKNIFLSRQESIIEDPLNLDQNNKTSPDFPLPFIHI